jgi:hypothetical protein
MGYMSWAGKAITWFRVIAHVNISIGTRVEKSLSLVALM